MPPVKIVSVAIPQQAENGTNMPFKQPRYNAALTRDNNARDRLLEPSGGVYIPEEPDYLQFRNIPASEIEERLLQQRALALTQGAPDVQEPDAGIPPALAARIEKEGKVRMTPEEETAAYLPPSPKLIQAFANAQKANVLPETPKAPPESAIPSATPVTPPAAPAVAPIAPSAPVAPPVSAAPVAPSAAPPAPPVPVAPSAAPVAPQEDRLTQLARIVSMSQQPQQTDEDRRRMAIMEALGNASAAMNAGLTRTPVPASVFAPPSALMQPQTKTDRLEQLYKASQILGKPEAATTFVDPVFIDNLRRQYPEANIPADLKLTRDQYQAFSANLDRERTELGKGKRFEEAQTTKKELAKIQQQTDATKFISKQSEKVKTEAEAVPYLKELAANPAVAESILSPGSTFRSKFAGGLLSTEEQQNFDRLVEGIAGPFRAGRFGLSQTSAELKNFEKLMGEADRTGNPVLRVKGLRDLIRSMRERLRNNWATARNADKDSEIYKQYKAYEEETGNTDNNEIFDTLINQLNDIIENAPEQQQTPWQKIKGAAVETGKVVTGGQPTQPRVQGPVAAPTPAPQTQAPAPAGNVDVTKFKRAQVGKEKGWYDVETGVFLTEEEYQALKSGTPATLSPRP